MIQKIIKKKKLPNKSGEKTPSENDSKNDSKNDSEMSSKRVPFWGQKWLQNAPGTTSKSSLQQKSEKHQIWLPSQWKS